MKEEVTSLGTEMIGRVDTTEVTGGVEEGRDTIEMTRGSRHH